MLFVHGAGGHGIGSTLIEFGQPLVEWLNGWLVAGGAAGRTPLGDPAQVGAAQIVVREADGAAPAHAELTVKSPTAAKHLWLLAESRWDEAFTPPSFMQVLVWSITVVPWTLLTQFIGPLVDEFNNVRPNVLSILRFLLDVVIASVLAIGSSLIILAVAAAVLVLSIVPLDSVRDIVGKLQRFVSSAVGDLYVVLMSPVERAALSGAVQRDIGWLHERNCKKVVVVAHSQGGFVAYLALADPWRRKVDKFITLGSGVIRLTESQQAAREGWLFLAFVGVVGAIIAIRFAPRALVGLVDTQQRYQASGLAFEIGLAMALGLVAAMYLYLTKRTPVEPLDDEIEWVDFVTRQDPVVNGQRGNRLPAKVTKIAVANRGSIIADHGSYWANRDQFVAQVVLEIAKLDPELGLRAHGPTRSDVFLREAYDHRTIRVMILRQARLLVWGATLLMIALRVPDLTEVGRPITTFLSHISPDVLKQLPAPLQGLVPVAIAQETLVGAAVILALTFVAYSIGVRLWDRWGSDDTSAEWAGRRANIHSPAAMAFAVWVVLHLGVVAIAALVGPDDFVRLIGYGWDTKNQIVQASTRHFGFGFVVALGAIGMAIVIRQQFLQTPSTSEPAETATAEPEAPAEPAEVPTSTVRSRLWGKSVVSLPAAVTVGSIVAGLIVLIAAFLRPGKSDWIPSLFAGLTIEVASVVVAVLVAVLGFVLAELVGPRTVAFAGRVGDFFIWDEPTVSATPSEIVGVLATVVCPIAAAILVVQLSRPPIGIGWLAAATGVFVSGRMIKRSGFLHLRLVGAAGAVASLVVLGFGSALFVAAK